MVCEKCWLSVLPVLVICSVSYTIAEKGITTTDGDGSTDRSTTSTTTLTINEAANTSFSSSLFLKNDLNNCNLTDTCHDADESSNRKQNFTVRSCMCDRDCSAFNDCCKDAEAQYETNNSRSIFHCVRTSFDGNIYMKTFCPHSWENAEIRDRCDSINLTAKTNDVLLKVPVTNLDKSITYKNAFCAICNDERHFYFWEVGIVNASLGNEENFQINLSAINETMISVGGKLPKDLASHIRFCVPDVVDTCDDGTRRACPKYTSYMYMDSKVYKNGECAACNNVSGSIHAVLECHPSPKSIQQNPPPDTNYVHIQNILTNYHCKEIPAGNSAFNLLCSDAEAVSYVDSCFLSTQDGKECLINSFFELGKDYYFVNDETIYVYQFKSNFSSSEWAQQSNKKIYLCGTSIPQLANEQFYSTLNGLLTNVLIKVSMIFLLIHFYMYTTTKQLQYPLARVIIYYCVTLFFTYTIYDIGQYLESCKVTAVLLHYLFLSCFAWLLVASYDCWRTICTMPMYRGTNDGNKESLKTALYCVVGWGLPILVVAMALYFELSSTQSISCVWKPGYGRLKQCFIAQMKPMSYFFYYPSTIMFIVNIFFFLYISLCMFLNVSTRRNFCVFSKLAVVTGLPWSIGLLVALTNDHIISLLYSVVNSSQGIFMFFAFAYNKEVVTRKTRRWFDQCWEAEANSDRSSRNTYPINAAISFSQLSKKESQSTITEYL